MVTSTLRLVYEHLTLRFHNILRSAVIYCTNFKPTRGAACIDNIATIIVPSRWVVEVHDWPNSDLSFVNINVKFCSTKYNSFQNNKLLPIVLRNRPWTNISLLDFRVYLGNIDWNMIL